MLQAHFTPPPPIDVAAWEAMVDSFDEGSPEEQRETFAILKKALDEDRPGQRRIFGEGLNP